MNSYEGKRIERFGRIEGLPVLKSGRVFEPLASQKIINHSPDGFNWGYGGSGPAQLALALLYDVCGNKVVAMKLHQDFKWQFVAKWGATWSIGSVEISDWIKSELARRDPDVFCEDHEIWHSGFCPECSRLRPQIERRER